METMPHLDVIGGESKVGCYKEQYCIGTCNAKSMNQCKLEVVNQKMARVSTDILRNSEQKCMGRGKFNLDDHSVYYVGKNPLEEME